MVFILLFQLAFICPIFTMTYLWGVRKLPGGRELFLFLISSFIWVLATIIEMFTHAGLWETAVYILKYSGASTTPVFILLFGLRYTGILKKYTKKVLFLITLYSLTVVVWVATNDFHHLMWKGYDTIGEYLKVYKFGTLYYTFALISYVITCASGAVFFFHTFKHESTRKEGLVLLLGFMLPWFCGMFYLADWNPFPGVDIIALGVGVSTLFISYSFRATGLFKEKIGNLLQSAQNTPTPPGNEISTEVSADNTNTNKVALPAEDGNSNNFERRKDLNNSQNRKVKIYNCMVLSIQLWENATSKTKIDFAEESGLWNVQTDPNGWRRTQTLDRYLSLSKFPEKPRVRSVVKSVEFILAHAHKQNYTDDSINQLNLLVNEIRCY
jgi:hypothetical protein